MKAAASAAAFVLFEQHAEAPARVVQMTCKKAPLQRSTPPARSARLIRLSCQKNIRQIYDFTDNFTLNHFIRILFKISLVNHGQQEYNLLQHIFALKRLCNIGMKMCKCATF